MDRQHRPTVAALPTPSFVLVANDTGRVGCTCVQGLVARKHDTPDRHHQLLDGVKTPRQLGTLRISNLEFGERTLAPRLGIRLT
jgi:hypothetical protein